MNGFEAAKREILEWVADTIEAEVGQIELDKPLDELGIDSFDAVHLIATIEAIIRQDLPEDVVKRVRTLNDIFEMMRERMAAA